MSGITEMALSYSAFNLFKHKCEPHKGMSYVYSQCLRTIRAIQDDSVAPDMLSTCRDAIASGKCTALQMRKQEIIEKKPLFLDLYEPSDPTKRETMRASMKLHDFEDVDAAATSYQRGWNHVGASLDKPTKSNLKVMPIYRAAERVEVSTPKPSPAPKSDSVSSIDAEADLAQAITKAAKS